MSRLPDFNPDRGLPDPNMRVPDLTECIEGWRAWKVSKRLPSFGVAPKLTSPSATEYYWAPRSASVAHCQRCEEVETPGDNCSCGFYSAVSYERLVQLSYHYYSDTSGEWGVIGQVANWGKVIPATLGQRAQKSYPVQLWIPYEADYVASALEDAYGVPVSLANILSNNGKKINQSWVPPSKEE